MRRFAACLAAFVFTAPAVAAPRDVVRELLMRRLSSQTRPKAIATNARRRAVQPPPTPACRPTVIAQPVTANWLILSGDTLYLSEQSAGIIRVPSDGLTQPVQVVARIGLDIAQLAVDDTHIYFITVDDATTGSIYRVSRNGGTATQLATKLLAPVDLAIDSASIYWINLGTIMGQDVAADGSIERMIKDGTGRQVLADKLSAPLFLVVDGNDLFFTESGLGKGSSSAGVRKLPKTGGTLTKLVDGDTSIAIATAGSDVFYSSLSGATPSVYRIAKSGGAVQTLISNVLSLSIAVRDGKLYTVAVDEEASTLILSVPASGGALRIIRAADFDTTALALDDCSVYYAAAMRLERTPR